jgi:hypothetical protein
VKLVHAVVACLVGAGLALYAATRVWSVAVTTRPGLPDLRAETTGAAEQPWLLALAVVALGGAGALLATRGVVRRGLGGLLMLTGLGLAIAAVLARTGIDPGAAGAAAAAGPAACVIGGVLIIAGGLGAARYGADWPKMGARYERRPRSADSPPAAEPAAATGPAAAAASMTGQETSVGETDAAASRDDDDTDRAGASAVDNRAAWDALDRGDDPTVR